VSISIGLGNIPPRCMVSFRFPRGYRGELARVYYLPDPTSGLFTDVALARRKNALAEGRVYDPLIDGTLYPARFGPSSPARRCEKTPDGRDGRVTVPMPNLVWH
jgi:hypothetical protein